MNNPNIHLFTHINKAIKSAWNEPAFTDYGRAGIEYEYCDVAKMAARFNLYFNEIGIKPGERISFCGVNSSNMAVSLFSIFTYGAVCVSILPDFSGSEIEKLVNHSDSQLLFVGPIVKNKIDFKALKSVKVVIAVDDFSIIYASDPDYVKTYAVLDKLFAEKYPDGFGKENVHYRDDNMDDLALINYTSGTESVPKGVMLTYRSLSTNVTYSLDNMPCEPGLSLVSILPIGHMFGMMIEFLYRVAGGSHIYFISRITTPVLMQAFKDCKPMLVLTVPLILEKIYEKKIKPIRSRKSVQLLWHVPIVGDKIKKKFRDELMEAFGGNINTVIAGGAPINKEVERFFVDIKFPFLMGYGMTECGPLITYTPWQKFKIRSCGRVVDRMELKIDSPKPHKIPGEILVRGEGVMTGYFKNEEATNAAFNSEGWMRTGDVGLLDRKGNLFIKGRSKNIILSSNGQNIYPEKIESFLVGCNLISECLVVERKGLVTALIFSKEINEETNVAKIKAMKEEIAVFTEGINKILPPYSHIKAIEYMQEEFQKTPKHSIKRFLYKSK